MPQFSHFENFASMDASRARARGRGRGGRRGQKHRHRGGRGGRGRAGNIISDDIKATLVDHVINHGLTMREAGQRVHPNLSRFKVSDILTGKQVCRQLLTFYSTQTVSRVFAVLYHITCTVLQGG